MTPSRNTRIALTATVVALAAAGAAMAATKLHHGHAQASSVAPGSFVSSSSASSSTAPTFGHRDDGRGPGGPGGALAAAATYLGITQSDLLTQLQAGKTLAQVANATSGKSESGLVDALYADAKTHIAADVTAGRLTQAQADQILANLKADITKHVESTGPPAGARGPGGPHGGGDDLAAAASYLGVTQTALQTQLQSGKTLSQIADATSGKSTAGLIAALVDAEKTEIEADVTAGRLTRAQADQIESGLTARFTAMANGQMPAHPDGHGGPWGPPPSGSAPSGSGSGSTNGTHI